MNVLVIGAGGIGSFLAQHISKAYSAGQLEDVSVTIADFDTVEYKNLLYQNFDDNDILENKSIAVSKKYPIIKSLPEKVDALTLEPYDFFIICADNFQIREIVFKHCHKNNKEFIDLRSEGNLVYASPKGSDLDMDIRTLENSTESGSCQIKADLDKGIIQWGNQIVAAIGMQMFLNFIRKNYSRRVLLKI